MRCRIISTIWPTVRSLCQHFVFTGLLFWGGTTHDRHVQKRSHDFSHNDKRMFEWTRDVQQRATATYRHVLTGPTSGPDWPLWRAGNVLPPRPLLLLLLHTVYFSVFSQVPPPFRPPCQGVQGGRAGPFFFTGHAPSCWPPVWLPNVSFRPFFKFVKSRKKWLINRRRSSLFFLLALSCWIN